MKLELRFHAPQQYDSCLEDAEETIPPLYSPLKGVLIKDLMWYILLIKKAFSQVRQKSYTYTIPRTCIAVTVTKAPSTQLLATRTLKKPLNLKPHTPMAQSNAPQSRQFDLSTQQHKNLHPETLALNPPNPQTRTPKPHPLRRLVVMYVWFKGLGFRVQFLFPKP